MGPVGDGFAVIDFETTGFAARKADRVVEIGVVCLDHWARWWRNGRRW